MTIALTTMAADPHEATRALLMLAQQEWESGRAEVDARRRRVVLAALEAGLSASEVARAMGMTHTRVLQISRDTR